MGERSRCDGHRVTQPETEASVRAKNCNFRGAAPNFRKLSEFPGGAKHRHKRERRERREEEAIEHIAAALARCHSKRIRHRVDSFDIACGAEGAGSRWWTISAASAVARRSVCQPSASAPPHRILLRSRCHLVKKNTLHPGYS